MYNKNKDNDKPQKRLSDEKAMKVNKFKFTMNSIFGHNLKTMGFEKIPL